MTVIEMLRLNRKISACLLCVASVLLAAGKMLQVISYKEKLPPRKTWTSVATIKRITFKNISSLRSPRLTTKKSENHKDLISEKDQDFMSLMRNRMEIRRTLVKNTCEELGLWKKNPLEVKFAVLKSYNTTYCFIPKSGCTNLKKILMALNGDVKDINKIEDNIHAFVSNHYRVDSVGIPSGTDGFLKLIVVRNPLERLFSSYMDKFAWQSGSLLPHFSKFSAYIHRMERQQKYKYDTQYLATFQEFIKFISKRDHSQLHNLIANHWSTYNRICQPCSIHYDIIMHLETIDEDFKYLLKLIKAPQNLQFPAGYGKNGSSSNKHAIVQRAYKKLKSGTLKNLYTSYKQDFDMFGYKFEF